MAGKRNLVGKMKGKIVCFFGVTRGMKLFFFIIFGVNRSIATIQKDASKKMEKAGI